MYRKELADGKGMLFDFSPEQEVSMWMKNTYISLDMIFIRADGRILRIAENTEPLSTKIIPSRGLAKGVLEVIAGTAQKYGIAPGDRVAHPLFNGHWPAGKARAGPALIPSEAFGSNLLFSHPFLMRSGHPLRTKTLLSCWQGFKRVSTTFPK